jgi:hypothetical protein
MENASTAPNSDIALPINSAHEHRNSSGDVGRDANPACRSRLVKSVMSSKLGPAIVSLVIATTCISIPVRAQTFQITDQFGLVLPQASPWYSSFDYCTPYRQCTYEVMRHYGAPAIAARVDLARGIQQCPPNSNRSITSLLQVAGSQSRKRFLSRHRPRLHRDRPHKTPILPASPSISTPESTYWVFWA